MDPRVPCRDCSIWPCICGNENVPMPTMPLSARQRPPRVPRDDAVDLRVFVLAMAIAGVPLVVVIVAAIVLLVL
jgi:hypothetical protein